MPANVSVRLVSKTLGQSEYHSTCEGAAQISLYCSRVAVRA